jgi:predicted phage-related endonuclease
MSIELEPGIIELDDTAQAWLLAYKDASAKIAELEEKRAVAREHLEMALGEAETACVKGHAVVRFTKVQSTRFDTKRAREILPAQVLDALEIISYSRRFTLVKDGE